MKKIILSLAFATIGMGAFAQIGAGTIMLGGSLGFNSTDGGSQSTTGGGTTVSTDKTARTSWNFSPAVGYFLTDDIALGIRLGLGGRNHGQATSQDGTTTENITSFFWNAELFGRYYKSLGSNFYIFGDLGLGYGQESWTDKEDGNGGNPAIHDGNEHKVGTFGVNLAPGVAFFPTENWGIDFTLNRLVSFSSSTDNVTAPNNAGEGEEKSTNFGIGVGLIPTVGLHYYIK